MFPAGWSLTLALIPLAGEASAFGIGSTLDPNWLENINFVENENLLRDITFLHRTHLAPHLDVAASDLALHPHPPRSSFVQIEPNK